MLMFFGGVTLSWVFMCFCAVICLYAPLGVSCVCLLWFGLVQGRVFFWMSYYWRFSSLFFGNRFCFLSPGQGGQLNYVSTWVSVICHFTPFLLGILLLVALSKLVFLSCNVVIFPHIILTLLFQLSHTRWQSLVHHLTQKTLEFHAEVQFPSVVCLPSVTQGLRSLWDVRLHISLVFGVFSRIETNEWKPLQEPLPAWENPLAVSSNFSNTFLLTSHGC